MRNGRTRAGGAYVGAAQAEASTGKMTRREACGGIEPAAAAADATISNAKATETEQA